MDVMLSIVGMGRTSESIAGTSKICFVAVGCAVANFQSLQLREKRSDAALGRGNAKDERTYEDISFLLCARYAVYEQIVIPEIWVDPLASRGCMET
jgi:hypothetical protein